MPSSGQEQVVNNDDDNYIIIKLYIILCQTKNDQLCCSKILLTLRPDP